MAAEMKTPPGKDDFYEKSHRSGAPLSVQERLVDRTIFALVVFGTPAVIASTLRAADVGLLGALVAHLTTYILFVLLLIFRKHVPYRLKAGFVLLAGFLAGLGGLVSFGIVGGALLAFSAVTTLATLFFGLLPGLGAALVTFLAAGAVGLLVFTRNLSFPYDISAYALSKNAWITALAAYGVLSAILVVCLEMLHSFLKQSIEDLKSRAMSLDKANRTLREEVKKKEEAQQALRSSEKKYRGILESLEEGTYELDLTGRMTFFNRALLDIYGYGEEEFLGLDYRKHIVEQDRERAYREFNTVFRTGVPIRSTLYAVLRKDGGKRCVESSIYPVRDQDGNAAGFRGVVRDITARVEMETHRENLERQLQEGQKWQAIGTLAGGVAHDFNNLLMGIQGNTSLLLLRKNEGDPERERLGNIETCVRDATRLTKQLLAYARGGRYEVKTTDISRLVERTAVMFGRTRKEILLALDLKSACNVEADRGQIQQVLLNLLVNSWQAMPGGGSMSVSTEDALLTEEFGLPEGCRPGRYARIAVRDTGAGMDEETLRRAFEPFFTTKDKARGTGLGLSSAYGIVRHHGGFMNLTSKPGEGCLAEVYLPSCNGTPEPEEEPAGDSPAGGSETVLLVDDEEVVLSTAGEMLAAQGYKVLTAGNGEKAAELASDNRVGIDLVILDMIMPGMGGEELFHKIREARPSVPVLLSSGYSLEGKAAALFAEGCSGFLQKPYSIGDLSRKVREVLGD
ncbi:MAG: PAS domain S-box protein [Thermodesulfobacteriota bacterium]